LIRANLLCRVELCAGAEAGVLEGTSSLGVGAAAAAAAAAGAGWPVFVELP